MGTKSFDKREMAASFRDGKDDQVVEYTMKNKKRDVHERRYLKLAHTSG